VRTRVYCSLRVLVAPITVVVITRDRAESLRNALAHLRALPERPEIIVVDNGSQDETDAAVAEAGVRGIFLQCNAGAAGRNIGVANAATPYVAFSDDDSWWAPGALARASTLMDDYPELGLVQGRILVGPQESLDPVCRLMTAGAPIDGFIACGAVVRREAFLQCGGFHPRYGVGGEEALLAIDLARKGWSLAYCDEIVAHHHPDASGARPGRRARMVRNDLWTAWLRARAVEAVRTTWQKLLESAADAETRRGLLQALRGLGWVLRERSA
jgi:N-acetylglucosaminyl-diphospho-decaprenol L-rhamnosyltransferase